MPVPEGSLLVDPVMVGSGYGDPLERDPAKVLDDFFNKAVSKKFAKRVYGVELRDDGHAVDQTATQKLRESMRAERFATSQPVKDGVARGKLSDNNRSVMRIHESLDIVDTADGFRIGCRSCKEDFGSADSNYKEAALYRVTHKDAITDLPPPAGRSSLGCYVEYFCKGCATQLDVETYVPKTDGDKVTPVWDIQISSNFERMLYEAHGRDPAAIRSLMAQLNQSKSFTIAPEALDLLRRDFSGIAAKEAAVDAEMKSVWNNSSYLLDPHTAIGVVAGREELAKDKNTPMVVLGTAHPAKFPDAVEHATGIRPALPPHLSDLLERTEHFTRLANDQKTVEDFIKAHVRAAKGDASRV
ncbi:MAG: hypothetical protein EBU34_07540 [Alphaproteobacteria bacterium]|nr:hypothetical protein [Alphaproteobacteria bacterium]